MVHSLSGRASRLYHNYPSQFWLMFWGMLISTIGSSMVWPFLMIYVTTRLKLPLTTAASLMTLNSVMALVSSFIAGPIIDRFGRKWMLVISLLGLGMVYFFYTRADTYAFTAALMALTGLFNPLYRVGGDAMMADLIPPEKRPDAYALLRMSNNLGVAIGPAVGGFVAASSYNFAFFGAATGMVAYAVLLAIFARETLPQKTGALPAEPSTPEKLPLGGYLKIFSDRTYMAFITAFTLVLISSALVWVLLGVHVKTNYGVSESLYGFIPMTNALMVVGLQALTTRQTKRHPALPVMAVGAAFYAVAVTSIAFGRAFPAFLISMVIMTCGELIIMPTSTTYVANLAPVDMRGRYMSLYSLTWQVAQGIGPLTGGYLSDHFGPSAPWFEGGVAATLAVTAFVWLAARARAANRLHLARTD